MNKATSEDRLAFDVLQESIERFRPLSEWTSIRPGTPGPEDAGPWLDYTAFTDAAAVKDLVTRRSTVGEYAEAQTPERVVGNYIFREVVDGPLGFAGYLWVRERRVPKLAANVMVNDGEWLQHWRWVRAEAVVVAGDPLGGAPGIETAPDVAALNNALFEEVQRFAEPVLAAFKANRYVAVANGWGSVLDALMYGAQLAGAADPELGHDGAWSRWDSAIAGRAFPVRRRPRRLRFEWQPGEWEELLVRAGCCLWYMTPSARLDDGTVDYCTTCYLKDDESRITDTIDWRRKVADGTAEEH